MPKNDFSKLNTAKKDTGVNEGAAAAEIERAKTTTGKKTTASKQEQQEREESMETRGSKGSKLPRINMAFSTSNYNFIKVMSAATGLTLTQCVNNIVSKYKEEHEDLMKKASEVYAEFVGDNTDNE